MKKNEQKVEYSFQISELMSERLKRLAAISGDAPEDIVTAFLADLLYADGNSGSDERRKAGDYYVRANAGKHGEVELELHRYKVAYGQFWGQNPPKGRPMAVVGLVGGYSIGSRREKHGFTGMPALVENDVIDRALKDVGRLDEFPRVHDYVEGAYRNTLWLQAPVFFQERVTVDQLLAFLRHDIAANELARHEMVADELAVVRFDDEGGWEVQE